MVNAASETYTIRISKGAGLVAETRTLLCEWHPGESAAELAKRVLENNLLGKSTARRVKDIVQRVFAPRYLRPEEYPAPHLKKLVERKTAGDWFRDLCLLYAARADRLVRDSVTVLLRNARDEGRISLSVDAVVSFLRESDQNGMMDQTWSPEVKKKIARGLLKVLTEFGFLTHRIRGSREIRHFRPHPLAIAYLALDLHFHGATDTAVTLHPDWRLWELDEPMVRDHLDELSRLGLWIFQAAGTVVRITWNVLSMEEAVDALARCNL
jgi:BrxA